MGSKRKGETDDEYRERERERERPGRSHKRRSTAEGRAAAQATERKSKSRPSGVPGVNKGQEAARKSYHQPSGVPGCVWAQDTVCAERPGVRVNRSPRKPPSARSKRENSTSTRSVEPCRVRGWGAARSTVQRVARTPEAPARLLSATVHARAHKAPGGQCAGLSGSARRGRGAHGGGLERRLRSPPELAPKPRPSPAHRRGRGGADDVQPALPPARDRELRQVLRPAPVEGAGAAEGGVAGQLGPAAAPPLPPAPFAQADPACPPLSPLPLPPLSGEKPRGAAEKGARGGGQRRSTSRRRGWLWAGLA
jgi:hypothetical protein